MPRTKQVSLNSTTTASNRLALDYPPLSSLTLDPENARIHKPAQIRQIARSIKAFSFNVPVLVDQAGKVLAGHGRVLACQHLGWTEVPVIRLEHLTPEQARAFAIADNRLTETSSWDEALLGQHLKILSEINLDFSIEATGFSVGEIDLKIESLSDAPAEDDPDDVPLPPGPAVTKPGDLWVLGRHRLLCASALDEPNYTRLMAEKRAAMIFTDPPYNVAIVGHVTGKASHREFAMASGEMSEPEFTAFLTNVCNLMAKVSTDGSLHYICMDWRHVFALMAAARTAYDDMINLCVWAKPQGGMGGLYRSAHELVLVFKHGRAGHRNNVQLGKFGRNRTNVWSYAGTGGFARGEDADLTAQHPTPKPVRMIADAMMDVTARGDVVLDPFMGSGSTLIAAERVGRACYGLELDPLYVDLTIRRWQRLTGDTAHREGDGAAFIELEVANAETRS
jgi:DNA modification methylase